MGYLKQKGFSLIELIVVVSVIGVLAAIGIPSYQQMIQSSQIRTAADSISSGFQLARAEAVKRNARVQFDFRGNTSAWTVCTRPAGGGACPADTPDITVQSRADSESGSANVVVAPTGGPYVFNGFGVMISPVGAAQLNITHSANASARALRVTVSPGGAVRTCDPLLPIGGQNPDPRSC